MEIRHVAAAMAFPCSCLAGGEARAQSVDPAALSGPVYLDVRVVTRTPSPIDPRYRPVTETSARTPAGRGPMIESWSLNPNADVALGRYMVPNSARPRTHTERMRDTGLGQERRGIAGVGVSLRF